tara:strand:+ start:613 stop:798 length:186 start_codon:yes stop_codon:yes gene_type:complete
LAIFSFVNVSGNQAANFDSLNVAVLGEKNTFFLCRASWESLDAALSVITAPSSKLYPFQGI